MLTSSHIIVNDKHPIGIARVKWQFSNLIYHGRSPTVSSFNMVNFIEIITSRDHLGHMRVFELRIFEGIRGR